MACSSTSVPGIFGFVMAQTVDAQDKDRRRRAMLGNVDGVIVVELGFVHAHNSAGARHLARLTIR
ncbi:hypothetical protein, partial [Klebsiella aerogenes]|uniref:hypothetical protein n=1 Tax=Klebsiella aerogenes TaxID=548 RepID=UPI0019540654